MPDTEENQAEYPQPARQVEGLGFPLMRAVALTSLATGMVLALATGPYAGKETGETSLFRTLFDKLRRGDLVRLRRVLGWRQLLRDGQSLAIWFERFRTDCSGPHLLLSSSKSDVTGIGSPHNSPAQSSFKNRNSLSPGR